MVLLYIPYRDMPPFAPSQAENGYRLRPFLSNDDMISAYTRSEKVHGF